MAFFIAVVVILVVGYWLGRKSGQASAQRSAPKPKTNCKWRQTEKGAKTWTCTTCQARVFSTDGRPPQLCKAKVIDQVSH